MAWSGLMKKWHTMILGIIRLAFTMTVCNVLIQWYGFQFHTSGFVPLSIAEFGL